MTAQKELEIMAKALRVALGYGSRTERIQRLLHSTDPDVAFLANRLKFGGYLRPIEGTIVVKPK